MFAYGPVGKYQLIKVCPIKNTMVCGFSNIVSKEIVNFILDTFSSVASQISDTYKKRGCVLSVDIDTSRIYIPDKTRTRFL